MNVCIKAFVKSYPNLSDVIAYLRILVGLSPSGYMNLDINNDGKIGLEEVIYVLQKIAGLR